MFVEISLLQCSHLPVSNDCGGVEHVDRRLRRESGRLLKFAPGKFTKNHRPVRLLSASYQKVRQKPLRTPKMRAFSLLEENSERGMLTTMNYLAETEKNGETGINLKTT